MATFTPVLKLTLPAFDQEPWDQDINNDLRIIDGAMASFLGVPNLVGIWKNDTVFTVGVSVIDSVDSSIWSCLIAHTSPSAPTTFSQDRQANPTRWLLLQAPARDFATQAAASASAAATSATNAATSATNAANSAATAATKVSKAGDTMTGLLILSGDPVAVTGAATKQYVDARVGGVGFLPTTGGTLTGALNLPAAAPTVAAQATNKSYVDGQVALRLALTGGTLTGALNLPATTPTVGTQATTKSYVDSTAAAQPFLKLTGGAGGQTVTGPLTISGTTVTTSGRLISRTDTAGFAPSVSAWSVPVNTNVGFWNSSSTTLSQIQFGNLDGSGLPTLTWGVMQPNAFFATSDLSLGMISGTITEAGPVTTPFRQIRYDTNNVMNMFNRPTASEIQMTVKSATPGFGNPVVLQLRGSDNALVNPTGAIISAGGFTVSDNRFKTNVTAMTYSISTMMALAPIEFNWLNVDGSTGLQDCGFSAQSVQSVYPECVKIAGIKAPDGTGGDPTGANPTLAISPMSLIALCVNCLQNIQSRLVAHGIT